MNTATSGGGAIDSDGTKTVTGSLFRGNIATNGGTYGSGGRLQIGKGAGLVVNTTFSGNQANGAKDDGGAITIYSGTLTLNNVTIAGNGTTSDGSTGAGAGGISVTPGATVTLRNTIVAGNSSPAGRSDLSGAVFSGGHNLVGDVSGSSGVVGWATGFVPWQLDEAGQTLVGYSVVKNSAPELFSTGPTIDVAGNLTYAPRPGAVGSATISVVTRDSGGTVNGGSDTSPTQTFTITITGNSINRVYLPL